MGSIGRQRTPEDTRISRINYRANYITMMSTNNPKDPAEANDGFDLIKYPYEYLFKAVCRVDTSTAQTTQETIHGLVLMHIEATRILSVYSNSSKTGKFESVSIKVQLLDRAELEAIYKAISDSPLVVMTL